MHLAARALERQVRSRPDLVTHDGRSVVPEQGRCKASKSITARAGRRATAPGTACGTAFVARDAGSRRCHGPVADRRGERRPALRADQAMLGLQHVPAALAIWSSPSTSQAAPSLMASGRHAKHDGTGLVPGGCPGAFSHVPKLAGAVITHARPGRRVAAYHRAGARPPTGGVIEERAVDDFDDVLRPGFARPSRMAAAGHVSTRPAMTRSPSLAQHFLGVVVVQARGQGPVNFFRHVLHQHDPGHGARQVPSRVSKVCTPPGDNPMANDAVGGLGHGGRRRRDWAARSAAPGTAPARREAWEMGEGGGAAPAWAGDGLAKRTVSCCCARQP